VSQDFVQAYVHYVSQNMRILGPGVGLRPINDANNAIIPTACELVQLAVYHDSNDKIYVAGDIWNHLNNTNKAALLVHEALYKKLRMNGKNTSERARMAVGAVFAGHNLHSITEGVPDDATLCWSEKTAEDRFAVYEQNQKAVFQFFRLNGKIPLTKTSLQTDLAFSPLAKSLQGGISAQARIDDSVLEQGARINWTLQRNDAGEVVMNLGMNDRPKPVLCVSRRTDSAWGESQSTDINVHFDEQNRNYLVNSSTQSCFNKYQASRGTTAPTEDIPPSHFAFRDFVIEWRNQREDLFVVSIQLNLQHLGQEPYKSTVAGDELHSLDWNQGLWDGVIHRTHGRKPTLFQATCPPRFGGIVIPEPNGPLEMDAKLTVLGFRRDDHGHEAPIRFEKHFKVLYQP